jgi:hypothetical protein
MDKTGDNPEADSGGAPIASPEEVSALMGEEPVEETSETKSEEGSEDAKSETEAAEPKTSDSS